MTAVAVAARWDLTWERGGAWRRTLRRVDRAGVNLGLAAPAVMEIRPRDVSSRVPATLVLTGTVASDHSGVELLAAREQIEALGDDEWEHRVIVTDPVRTLPIVLLRGYITITDGVSG